MIDKTGGWVFCPAGWKLVNKVFITPTMVTAARQHLSPGSVSNEQVVRALVAGIEAAPAPSISGWQRGYPEGMRWRELQRDANDVLGYWHHETSIAYWTRLPPPPSDEDLS